MGMAQWLIGMGASIFVVSLAFSFMKKVYKNLTRKDGGIDTFINGTEQKMNEAAETVAEKLRNRKKKDNRPVVTIR